jgi:hypothetical protein
MYARQDLKNASATESDRYEELLVNPTLLFLLSQRGNIDCGGLAYVVVRYGNFNQLVVPLPDGHVSVALDSDTNLDATISDVQTILEGIASSWRQ